jgi:nucleoid DNA-binding protein
MNKAELLEAVQRQTKLRPTHVKRVVDAIFDPEDGVISRQVKRGGQASERSIAAITRRAM